MLTTPFDPTKTISYSEGRFPRIRRVVRYAFASALTALAYGLLAFCVVCGARLAYHL